MASFTQEQIAGALDAKSAHLSEKDVQRISDNRETVLTMINDFPDSWAKARRQATLLLDLASSNLVPLESRKVAAGALIYLGAPLDLVPDDEEDGFADDAAIVGLAISRIEVAVRTYVAERKLNLAEYLD